MISAAWVKGSRQLCRLPHCSVRAVLNMDAAIIHSTFAPLRYQQSSAGGKAARLRQRYVAAICESYSSYQQNRQHHLKHFRYACIAPLLVLFARTTQVRISGFDQMHRSIIIAAVLLLITGRFWLAMQL